MNNNNKRYTPPKFKKGVPVNSPSGEGIIEGIVYQGGGHFYLVNNSYYAEGELGQI
jgi:hypothetical protein